MPPKITPDYLKSQGLNETFPKRFWLKVGTMDANGCIPWIGSTAGRYKHGQIGRGGDDNKKIYAHVALWILLVGPVPPKAKVLHKCNNPGCVNIKHLELGDQKRNIEYMIECRRDRFNFHVTPPRGELSANHILTKQQAAIIKKSDEPGVWLADKYGVSQATISAIRHNRIWAWL